MAAQTRSKQANVRLTCREAGAYTLIAMPPRFIGQYQIVTVLGSGGIGCVYRAVDQRTGDEVALKLLSSGPALDSSAARRMAREFEALYDLSHPNVVRVFDTGVYRGYPYLTMELIEGLTLREYLSIDHSSELSTSPNKSASLGEIRERSFASMSDDSQGQGGRARLFDVNRLAEEADSDPGLFAGEHISGRGPAALRQLADAIDEPPTEDEAAPDQVATSVLTSGPRPEHEVKPKVPDLGALNRPERVALLKDALLQVCGALAYVHARGMVHRDLKPTNIMVDDDRLVKLMDFGLAKFLAEDSAVTASGHIVGTYRYMAPEQLMGEPLDGRSDLYSLGVMLYELLAGRPPFDAKSPVEMCHKVLEQEAQLIYSLNPDVDDQLARIAHRLMSKDPGARYQTAEEVYEVLVE
jgi:serine/threonine protein kinase